MTESVPRAKALRICALSCDCYPDDIVRRLAEAAVAAGHQYHVVCPLRQGQQRDDVFNRVAVHRVFMRAKDGTAFGAVSGLRFGQMIVGWSRFSILAFVRLARLHLEHRFDVIHVHNMPDFLVFAALVPKILGARIILHVQDTSPELMVAKTSRPFRRIGFQLAAWQEQLSAALSDHVMTVGWPFEELLLKRGVPKTKLSSILNSADPEIFPIKKRTPPFLREATPDRPLIVMYHGTINQRSGLDVAVRAFEKARSRAPHLRLHFKGRGPALEDVKSLAQQLGIADRLTFFPEGPIEEVADFVAAGDIGVIPYRSDGFMDLLLPTKAYEFALMRRPMIVSDTMAMRSMFGPASVARFEPSNVDDLAEAMVDLYEHPAKRAQLVENAEQDYVPYRWELMSERYQGLLASLVAS